MGHWAICPVIYREPHAARPRDEREESVTRHYCCARAGGRRSRMRDVTITRMLLTTRAEPPIHTFSCAFLSFAANQFILLSRRKLKVR